MKLPKRLKVCVTPEDILAGQIPGQKVRAESCPIARAAHTALRKILGSAHPGLVIQVGGYLTLVEDGNIIKQYRLSTHALEFVELADMLQPESSQSQVKLEPATFYCTRSDSR